MNDLDLVVVFPGIKMSVREALEKDLLEPPHNKNYGKSNSLLGKTWEEIHGVGKAEGMKEQLRKTRVGKSLSPAHCTNISKGVTEKWKDPKYVNRVLEGWGKRPNKLERMFDRLLRLICPKEFKYNTGKGKFKLGGKRPDFLNINGKKKLIEVYGDYHHKGDDPQERIDYFKQYGYDCLVIWEHEIRKEPLKVAERVLLFIGRNG